MADECPVCLEPLEGTIVQMACCKNKVHIQCYVPKCPLCRSPLPLPRAAEPNQIIVPVPVPAQLPAAPRTQKAVVVVLVMGTVGMLSAMYYR